ncbi:hypothetical protein OAN24_01080 [Pseudodesulfovibrio sp.]|nr:hypothetical protein [Pseudodesulfovibrio sp.]
MDTKKNRKHALIIVLAPIIYMLGVASIVYHVDPWQIYHAQNSGEKTLYWNNQRYINAGRIRTDIHETSHFTTIWTGTSVTQDIYAPDVEKLIGLGPALQLTVVHGFSLEQFTTLKYALESGIIKCVIWEMNPPYIGMKDPTEWWNPNYEFPSYLYSTSPFEKLKYLINSTAFKQSLDMLRDKCEWPENNSSYYMHTACKKNSFTRFLDIALKKQIDNFTLSVTDVKQKGLKTPSIRLIRSLVTEYPKTTFYLYIPPLPTYRYAQNKEEAEYFVAFAEELTRLAATQTNTTLFAFDDIPAIADNLANYRDTIHYGTGVDRFILKSMKEKKHVLTLNNLPAFLNHFTHNVSTYQPTADTGKTISFEGPLNETLFSVYPPPYGPSPVSP